MKQIIAVVCVAIVFIKTTAAFDKEVFMKVGEQCQKDTNTPDEEVKDIMNMDVPKSPEMKCMMACVFKAMGVMSPDGKYDEEGNKKAAAEAFKNDPEKLAKAQKYSELCRDEVNAVDDDDKGCERASAMFGCTMKKAKELGYTPQ